MRGFAVYTRSDRAELITRYKGHPTVRVNEDPARVLDRGAYDKLTCYAELRARLLAEPGVYVVRTDVMAGGGTRADVLDLYNLISDGAAGVVLDTDDDYVVDLCAEIYQHWVEDHRAT